MKITNTMRIGIIILTIIPTIRPFIEDEIIPDSVMIELDYSFTDKIDFQIIGTQVAFRCSSVMFISEYDTVTIEFFRNDWLLQKSQNNTIQIKHLKLLDSGSYSCRITISKMNIQSSKYPYNLRIFRNTYDPRYTPMPYAEITEAGLQDGVIFTNMNRLNTVVLKCSINFNVSRIESFTFLMNDVEHFTYNNTDSIHAYHKTWRIGKNSLGNYSCRANTHTGPIYSAPLYVPEKQVDLMIIEDHVFNSNNYSMLQNIEEKIVNEGTYFRIYCKITTAPNLAVSEDSIQWLLNDKKLRINRNYPWKMAQVGNFLSFDYMTRNYSGTYRCQVNTSNYGVVKSWNEIRVKVEPKKPKVSIFTQHLRKKESTPVTTYKELPTYMVKEGDNIYLPCNVTLHFENEMVSQVTWAFSGRELVPSYEVDILQYPPVLLLPNIKQKYSGYFTCHAITNEGGEETSDPIMIEFDTYDYLVSVNFMAVELLHNGDFIYKGQDITMLYCHSHPASLSYQTFDLLEQVIWFLNGRTLKEGKYRNDSDTFIRAKGSILEIYKITDEFEGTYTCQPDTYGRTKYTSYPVNLPKIRDLPVRLPESHIYSATFPLWRENQLPEKRESEYPVVFARQQNDPNNTYENEFVYIHCTVFPSTLAVTRITWFREMIESRRTTKVYRKLDIFSGVDFRVNDRTLILPSVDKWVTAKSFACLADTDYGSILSEFVPVRIQNGPRKNSYIPNNGEVNIEAYVNDKSLPKRTHVIIFEYIDSLPMVCAFLFPFNTVVEEIRWYFNDVRIHPKKSMEFRDNNNTLFFKGARLADTGNYSCEMSSHLGILRSNKIRLDVVAEPTMIIPTSTMPVEKLKKGAHDWRQ